MTAWGPRSMRKMVPQGTPRGRSLCHCGERVQGQGLCKKHYQMARRDGTIKIVQPHHRMRNVPLTEGGLTWDELKDDMSGPRCRCGLRLSTAQELRDGKCSDCLPRTLNEFIKQRMQAPSNWVTGPRTGEE